MSQIEDYATWSSKERKMLDDLLIPMVRDESAIYDPASRETGMTFAILFTRMRNAMGPSLQASGLGSTVEHYIMIL